MVDLNSELRDRIQAADVKYGEPSSSHESLGVITEEFHELVEAVKSNSATAVKREALDVAAACIRLAEAIGGAPNGKFWTRSGFR